MNITIYNGLISFIPGIIVGTAVFSFLRVKGPRTFSFVINPAIPLWVGGAISAFVDGFVDGFPGGSTAGGALAIADGQAHLDAQPRHILIEIAHILAVPIFTGLADIKGYKKQRPVPDLFISTTHENKPITPPGSAS